MITYKDVYKDLLEKIKADHEKHLEITRTTPGYITPEEQQRAKELVEAHLKAAASVYDEP